MSLLKNILGQRYWYSNIFGLISYYAQGIPGWESENAFYIFQRSSHYYQWNVRGFSLAASSLRQYSQLSRDRVQATVGILHRFGFNENRHWTDLMCEYVNIVDGSCWIGGSATACKSWTRMDSDQVKPLFHGCYLFCCRRMPAKEIKSTRIKHDHDNPCQWPVTWTFLAFYANNLCLPRLVGWTYNLHLLANRCCCDIFPGGSLRFYPATRIRKGERRVVAYMPYW